MALHLTNVSVYDDKDQPVITSASADLTQQRGAASFDTELVITSAEVGKLADGANYYVVGLKPDGTPTRSEAAVLTVRADGQATLAGSIAIDPNATRAPQPKAVGDSEADILISYENFSSTAFNLSTNWSNLQDGFGGLTVSPGPTLAANDGNQSMGANQILSVLDEGPADIGLCWAQGYNFGVWIHFNFQFAGMGPRPVWYVSTNGSDWALAGSDPSQPYTWNASQVGGLSIVGTPNSGHSSLTVTVTISQSS